MLWKTQRLLITLTIFSYRNLRHRLDSLAWLSTAVRRSCLSYRLHRNHNMTDNRFLYALLLITLSTMCFPSLHTESQLLFQLISHFPIRFPFAFTTPWLGHIPMMITHFRVEYWKRVYRVSVASGLYKQQHNFWPPWGPVHKRLPFFCLACLVVFFHFFRFMSHIRKKDDEIR